MRGNIFFYHGLVNVLICLPDGVEHSIENDISLSHEAHKGMANGSVMIGKRKFVMLLVILPMMTFIGIMKREETEERELVILLLMVLIMMQQSWQLTQFDNAHAWQK